MNLLLIQPDSLSPDRRFTVSGERAEHIRTVLRAKPGDPVKTGFLNGKTGSSILLEVEKDARFWKPASFPQRLRRRFPSP